MIFSTSSLMLSLLLFLNACSVSAAKKPAVDRFQETWSKAQPIKLNDNRLNRLIRVPRDFGTTVILTALEPRFGCSACRDFQPEWELLARSWQKGDKSAQWRTVFGTLDFVDGKETFQSLGLQHAPILLYYPPTTGPNAKSNPAPVRLDFTSAQTADSVHSWLSRQLPQGPKPKIVRPFNYMRLIVSGTTVLGLLTLLAVASPYVLPVVRNRNLWAAGSLIAVLLFTSGHMYNHIRKVPYVAGDGRGGVSYFAGGFQNQFGLETQIVAALYGALAFAAISLAVKCPRIADPRQQQVAILMWGGGLFLMYSFLLSLFRFKNGGYPFYLPPF